MCFSIFQRKIFNKAEMERDGEGMEEIKLKLKISNYSTLKRVTFYLHVT